MISIPRATSNEDSTRRYNHIQQPSTIHNPQLTNHSLNIPRGWAIDLPSASAIDLLQAQLNDPIAVTTDFLPPDANMSDAWSTTMPHLTSNKMGRAGNHQRESSHSSLGSAGPASPYNHSTSNPQIAVTNDFGHEALDLQTNDTSGNHSYISKSLSQYTGYQNLEAAIPEMHYPITIPGPGSNNDNGSAKVERGLLAAHDFASNASRTQANSVASSVGGDSPATPTIHDTELMDRRRKAAYGNVPKLDRTLTDIYSDELYNPNFAITSTSPSQTHLAMSPVNDVFHQRINAANNQHLSARQSPVMTTTSRDRSPFRTTSPLSTTAQDFSAPRNPLPHGIPFNSAQRLREQGKAQNASQTQQELSNASELDTLKTISPKDAIIEFPEGDENTSNFPLFASEGPDVVDNFTKSIMPQSVNHNTSLPQSTFNFMVPQMHAAGLQIPQQYPFVAASNNTTPPRLSPAGSSIASSGSTPVSRPRMTAADGGTYTCTYHGCTLRFETPAMLQKHKREGHRQAQSLGIPRPQDTGMTSGLIGSQAGPHRCNRINPSTGKPCSTVFSRPYDLTRHEDTIHNARKQKVNCDLCTEEKTFSRADALTRHYRVCHPEVEVPGKRRRG